MKGRDDKTRQDKARDDKARDDKARDDRERQRRDAARLTALDRTDRQAGALAWLPDSDPVRFVLVTSRRQGRWVFPKGAIDPGMTPPQAAAQEAREEAGVVGTPEPEPIGTYRSPKIRPPLVWTVEVMLFPLRIDEVLDVWPEAGQRSRRFVTLEEARKLLADPAMVALAEAFLRRGE